MVPPHGIAVGMRAINILLKTASNCRFMVQYVPQLHLNGLRSARTQFTQQERGLVYSIRHLRGRKYARNVEQHRHLSCVTVTNATALSLCDRELFDRSRSYCHDTRDHCHSHAGRNCWKCGKAVDPNVNVFCECGVVQSPDWKRSYFGVLGVEETFDLDTKLLAKAFRDLQRLLHPDKFAGKSETERSIADQQSSQINKAYDCLVKPLCRGLHLLEIKGFSTEESEIQVDSDFLMEIMETNEQLAEITSINEARKIGKRNSIILEELISKLSHAFKELDYPKAKVIITKLKYFANIDEKVKEIELSHADSI